MARGKVKWHFPDMAGGQGGGFNDAGIDKFKFRASIWRETAQNSIDQWCGDPEKPCIITYKLDEYKPSTFFINARLKKIFNAAKKYDKSTSDKGDGQEFYKKAGTLLKQNKIAALSIRDYNTNGLPKHPHDNTSAYHRLIISPGSTRQTGMAGGSHGHGQKATFAKSNLRTVFYYSYVDKGIKNLNSKELYVGKTLLNQWENDEGIEKVPVGFYGDFYTDPDNPRKISAFPLTGSDIPEQIKRTNPKGDILTGTDIYIVEPKLAANWQTFAEREVINNFFGSIEAGYLEVRFKNKRGPLEEINKDNLNAMVMKHSSEAEHYLKALREPVNGKPFIRDIPNLGKVKLYISQHEGGNQKIAFMRKPRMLIQTLPRKVLSNFSGVILIDSKEGNNNLRLAENPRHDKLLKHLMHEHFDEHVDFIGALYEFIDDKIEELKGSDSLERLDIPGLGNLLPGLKDKDRTGEDDSENKDNVPTKKILGAEVKNISKVKLGVTTPPKTQEIKKVIEDEDGDLTRLGKRGLFRKLRKRFREGPGEDIASIPAKNIKMRSYLIARDGNQTKYFVKIELLHDSKGSIGYSFIGEDNIRINPKITSIEFKEESTAKPDYKLKSNRVTFGELKKGDVMEFDLTIKDNMPAALVVEG